MTLRSALSDLAHHIVQYTLTSDGDPEVERLLVAGAIIARDGDHYRIECGGESPAELETKWRLADGRCDCGNPLSMRAESARCRSCGREYSLTS